MRHTLATLVVRDWIVFLLECWLRNCCITNNTLVVAETISRSIQRDAEHPKFVSESIIHFRCDLQRDKFRTKCRWFEIQSNGRPIHKEYISSCWTPCDLIGGVWCIAEQFQLDCDSSWPRSVWRDCVRIEFGPVYAVPFNIQEILCLNIKDNHRCHMLLAICKHPEQGSKMSFPWRGVELRHRRRRMSRSPMRKSQYSSDRAISYPCQGNQRCPVQGGSLWVLAYPELIYRTDSQCFRIISRYPEWPFSYIPPPTYTMPANHRSTFAFRPLHQDFVFQAVLIIR